MARILHVEDDDDFHEYVRAVVEGQQHMIDQVRTLEEAIACVEATPQRWEGILLDLNLVDSSGVRTFTKLARVSGLIPITVLTGWAEDAEDQSMIRIVDKSDVTNPGRLRAEIDRLIAARKGALADGGEHSA